MPIYEYRCEDCQKQLSVFIRNIANLPQLRCRFCGSERLSRLLSRIATPKSEESRLEGLADSSPMQDLDEQDPQSMERWMKKMAGEMGEDCGDDVMADMESASTETTEGGAAASGDV
jgi:putative FmdB family regulatory protein